MPYRLFITGIIFLEIGCTNNPSIDFSTQVKPIINAKCISCHGGVKQQAGFSLLFEEEAVSQLSSGKFGIVPGHASGSEMIRRLSLKDPEERMPYQEEPLSDEEIQILTQWIDEGASWGKHWAYEPINEVVIPETEMDWGSTTIDQFIVQGLVDNGLDPSPRANTNVLARRAALDIIGLPNFSEERDQYLDDPSSVNYEHYINSLLTSPHYGEKWASMWLDLARYADTKGYERDGGREIWRYRDWLIKAFNDNMPYDQFLIEQLAGDLLPNPTDDQLIATAFHRNTMTNDEGGTENEEYRTAAVLDRVNTTWQALMSTTFACVQCHSHPYDPFKHEEYYQFAAYFNNTRDEDTYADYPVLRHYDASQRKDLGEIEQWLDRSTTPERKQEIIQFVKTLVPARNSINADQFVNAELGDTKWLIMRNPSSARLKDVRLDGRDKLIVNYKVMIPGGSCEVRLDSLRGKLIGRMTFPDKTIQGWKMSEFDLLPTEGIHDIYFSFKNEQSVARAEQDLLKPHVRFDWFYFTNEFPGKGQNDQEKIKNKYWELVTAEVATTPIMVENPPYLERETHVFERGNWLLKSTKVEAGVPQSLNNFPEGAPNNRLGMAQWLTAKENPLTARTMVNRVWEQLFGVGLVETLEDMGTQGASVTHRALLDHLSWRFMHEMNWNVKALIKEIVMSDTYQQSSKTIKEHLEKDPDNRYLARMPRMRLSAEQIRDQALATSGALNAEMYGPPVMPYQPDGIWLSPYDAAEWKKSSGNQQYRRALYTYWKRTSPYPSFLTFDGVGREVCSSRRIRTNTPLQALATLNDSVFIDLSKKLTLRVWELQDKNERISTAYELVAGKKIGNSQLKILENLYHQSLEIYQADLSLAGDISKGVQVEDVAHFGAMVIVANAIFNLDDVMTKS